MKERRLTSEVHEGHCLHSKSAAKETRAVCAVVSKVTSSVIIFIKKK